MSPLLCPHCSAARRLIFPLYLYACPRNLLRISPQPAACVALVVWVAAQAVALACQMRFGPRCEPGFVCGAERGTCPSTLADGWAGRKSCQRARTRVKSHHGVLLRRGVDALEAIAAHRLDAVHLAPRRCFIPRAWLPQRYDYFRPATRRELGLEEPPGRTAAAHAGELLPSSVPRLTPRTKQPNACRRVQG